MKKFSGINKVLVTLVILLAATFSFSQNAGAKSIDDDGLFGNGQQAEGKFHHGHGERGGYGRHGERMHAFMAEQLGITDEQKAQIKQIRQNHKDSIKPIAEELRSRQKELRQSFDGDNYNETLAAQKISEMSGLKAKLIGEQLKMKKEILAVFTPEQRTKMEQLKEQFKARHAERMNRREFKNNN
jgi:protein CpxP